MAGSSSTHAHTMWIVPLIVFAGVWELAARLVQRPRVFPTLIDTLGQVPSMLTVSTGESVLNSILDVIIGFAVAAVVALMAGALLKRSAGALPGFRLFLWLAVGFLSLALTRLATGGLGPGTNAIYVVGGVASCLLMLLLLSSGIEGAPVLNLGALAAWVGVLTAEANVGGQNLGSLAQKAGQSGPQERFYALCLLCAVLGLLLVEIVDLLSVRLDLGRPRSRR